jgi:hypothetical protein
MRTTRITLGRALTFVVAAIVGFGGGFAVGPITGVVAFFATIVVIYTICYPTSEQGK